MLSARYRRPLVALLVGVGLICVGCGQQSNSPAVSGGVTWPDEDVPEQVGLSTAFFIAQPTDASPNLLKVIVTGADTTCDDAVDGRIDSGDWPIVQLVFVMTDNVQGTYDILFDATADELQFGGALIYMGEDMTWRQLSILSGTLEISGVSETQLDAWIEVNLGDSTSSEDIVGQLSGSFSATFCSP